MSDEERQQPGKRPRAHSAKGRLSTPPEQTTRNETQVKREFDQRLKSAAQIRDAHTRAGKTMVFAKKEKRKDKVERFSTSYCKEFTGEVVLPPAARPSSPTRRNNPHPNHQFMTWKVPGRTFGKPLSELMKDAQTTFQQDYIGDYDDANDDLLDAIERIKISPTEPSSKDYGQYLREQQKYLTSRQSNRPPFSVVKRRPTFQTLNSDILQRTVKGDSFEAFDTWLRNASAEEQHTILKMLKAAESAQVEDVLSKTMQPAAADAIKTWISSAPVEEREVVTRLFSAIGQRHRPPSRSVRLQRSRSFSEGGAQMYRPSTGSYPNIERPQSAKSTSNRMQHRPNAPPPLGSMKHPSNQKQSPGVVWHHKAVREPPMNVYHRGSIFGVPSQEIASHYTIHPEWPDYYPTDNVTT